MSKKYRKTHVMERIFIKLGTLDTEFTIDVIFSDKID